MTTGGALDAILAGCDGLPTQQFADGETLIAEGPNSGLMFVLVEGTLEVVKNGAIVADLDAPGSIVGEMAALLGEPHSATVRASGPVTAYRIDDAPPFLRQRPEMMFHIACILARRLTEATSYLADVKHQYADRADHLGMIDEVLETLLQKQNHARERGSRLKVDPRL